MLILDNENRILQVQVGVKYGLGFYYIKKPLLGIEYFKWSMTYYLFGLTITYGKRIKPNYGDE